MASYSWTDFVVAMNPSNSTKPPPLPQKDPPIILPKELLVGARQLKPEEIGPAVLKAVEESKKVEITSTGVFGMRNPFGVPMDAGTQSALTAMMDYERNLSAQMMAFDPGLTFR